MTVLTGLLTSPMSHRELGDKDDGRSESTWWCLVAVASCAGDNASIVAMMSCPMT